MEQLEFSVYLEVSLTAAVSVRGHQLVRMTVKLW